MPEPHFQINAGCTGDVCSIVVGIIILIGLALLAATIGVGCHFLAEWLVQFVQWCHRIHGGGLVKEDTVRQRRLYKIVASLLLVGLGLLVANAVDWQVDHTWNVTRDSPL